MIWRRLLFVSISFLLLSFYIPTTIAVECEGEPPKGSDNAQQIREYIDKCQKRVDQLVTTQDSLKAAISTLNSKINLAQARILQTSTQISSLQKEITVLTEVVGSLQASQNGVEQTYQAKAREIYRRGQIKSIYLFLSSKNLTEFITKSKFIRTATTRDRLILLELNEARTNYLQQKNAKEVKQQEVVVLQTQLITQKKDLDSQQNQKKILLSQTHNDEKRYQELLSKARAELLAIEAVIAGRGSETEVGPVDSGNRIATIISGPSACSTGTHLHFEVAKDEVHQNPTSTLKQTDIVWDNYPDPPFTFSGAWDWPIANPPHITQGYGHTSYSSRYANDLHTGIDAVNDDLSVKAVKAGTLYRGSIPCGGGTLKYVHVRHKDDGYDTYYLHVNYF